MRMTRKPLLLLLCAVMLVVGSIMGTMAYLTDTAVATNTFTVGNVTLGDEATGQKALDEAAVDEYGVPEPGAARVDSNEYKLLPGHTYVKDPTIHVNADSEDCYLFAKVENGIALIEDSDATVASQMAAKGWKLVEGQTNVYVYAYTDGTDPVEKTAVAGGSDVVIFESFTVDGDNVAAFESNEAAVEGVHNINYYADKAIVVTAYAIQADGMNDKTVAEIWAAVGA